MLVLLWVFTSGYTLLVKYLDIILIFSIFTWRDFMESEAILNPPSINRLMTELAMTQKSINKKRLDLLQQLRLVCFLFFTLFLLEYFTKDVLCTQFCSTVSIDAPAFFTSVIMELSVISNFSHERRGVKLFNVCNWYNFF